MKGTGPLWKKENSERGQMCLCDVTQQHGGVFLAQSSDKYLQFGVFYIHRVCLICGMSDVGCNFEGSAK